MEEPPIRQASLNVDASYNSDRGTGSTGAIIRDSSGSFTAASSCFIEHVVDASMAEVIALTESLLLAQQIGCSRLMIQSDCLEVVETMKQDGITATTSAPVYDECNQLSQDFVFIAIEHCNREANRVADVIARVAITSKSSCIWVDEPPSFILEALVNDVTVLGDQ
jgi:ribonuclease HI